MAKKNKNTEIPEELDEFCLNGNESLNVFCSSIEEKNQKSNHSKDFRKEVRIIASSTSVPFQNVPLPYTIDKIDELAEFERAMNNDLTVVLVPLKNQNLPLNQQSLNDYGIEMKVMKIIDLPDGKKNAFLLGGDRIKLKSCKQLTESSFSGIVTLSPDQLYKKDLDRFELTMGLVNESYEYVRNYFAEIAHVQMAAPKELQEDKQAYLNFMIVTSSIDFNERVKLLNEDNLLSRAEKTYVALENIKRQIDLRKEIFSKAAADIDREQRDHFLRTQIRQIQNEIGEGSDNDIEILTRRSEQKIWNEDTQKSFEKELRKLSRYAPNSPDYAIQYTYLDTFLNLPWENMNDRDIDIKALEEDLNKEHYGLEKIKERIIEHIAVLKLKGDMRSPILCLYGPPGVGKTSLCKSIADSLGREYARISLGGLHDETQLRGHRRTYIGALPGRIISALEKLDTNNPIFVLDEIDKIGNDHRGDPSHALLEILDPEQNSKFHDNYLDVDYNLSKIFFIATANSINGIPGPLLDRMELIDVSGYLVEEKIEIAKRHLIPKVLENHGFRRNEIKFSHEAIEAVIELYTRESGVRKLEKTLSRILRKIAVLKAKGEKFPKKIDKNKVLTLLGKEERIPEIYRKDLPVGVAAGLAWTSVGGEILYFESSLSKGKGVLTMTGNLGEVMKESATIALQWIKANAEFLSIDPELFGTTDVHLHVPEGAVPKDGPSAGITMVCAIASSFTGKRLRNGIAMTGEATLSGRVLPVGGIKEKILAAKRAGITEIILSSENKRDIKEIPLKYIEGLNFKYVDDISQVISYALENGD